MLHFIVARLFSLVVIYFMHSLWFLYNLDSERILHDIPADIRVLCIVGIDAFV